jgi:transposase
MSSRSPYATDLSDEEWWILEPLTSLKLVTRRQAPRPRDPRAIGRHIFYAVVRGGCAWRLLPHEFPPWQTIYHYFRTTWRLDGTWERINRASCASASARWRVAKRCAQRGDHGQSVGEDHGERRRSRLRRCQEDKRPQTPPFGRYRRTGDEGKKSASC